MGDKEKEEERKKKAREMEDHPCGHGTTVQFMSTLLGLRSEVSDLEPKWHPAFRVGHCLLSLNLCCESHSSEHTDKLLPPVDT